jgi:threonine dehydrogenase-like Zn-dependent dehydrogenase
LRHLRVLSRITVVLVTGAGAIGALIGAAVKISTGARIRAAFTIERQQRLRDPRLDLGFMVGRSSR